MSANALSCPCCGEKNPKLGYIQEGYTGVKCGSCQLTISREVGGYLNVLDPEDYDQSWDFLEAARGLALKAAVEAWNKRANARFVMTPFLWSLVGLNGDQLDEACKRKGYRWESIPADTKISEYPMQLEYVYVVFDDAFKVIRVYDGGWTINKG